MKAPAFQWYAADYLADERVMQLTLEAEAVYVRLLNYCWREGTIPANAAHCAPMCKYADVKVIKAALALFTKSPTQPGRLIHKRLEEERGKQEAFRERQAAHGKRGGRPAKKGEEPDPLPDEKPNKANPLPSLSQPLAEPKPARCASSSTSSTSSNEDGGGAPPPPASSLKADSVSKKKKDVEAEDAAVFLLANFAPYVRGIGYGQVDIGLYLLHIQAAGKGQQRDETGWERFILAYLNKDRLNNRLMLPLPTAGRISAGGQPLGKSDNEPDYRLNLEATARRRRETEERENRMLAENLARVAANDLKAAARLAGPLPA